MASGCIRASTASSSSSTTPPAFWSNGNKGILNSGWQNTTLWQWEMISIYPLVPPETCPGMYVAWNAFTKTPCPKTRMAGRTKRQDFIVLIANHQQMKDLPGMPMYEHFPWQSPKFKSGKPCQKNSTKHCKKTTDLGPRRNRRIPWACRRLSPLTWMQCLKGLKSDFQVWIFRVQKTSCLYFLTAI